MPPILLPLAFGFTTRSHEMKGIRRVSRGTEIQGYFESAEQESRTVLSVPRIVGDGPRSQSEG